MDRVFDNTFVSMLIFHGYDQDILGIVWAIVLVPKREIHTEVFTVKVYVTNFKVHDRIHVHVHI